MKRGRTARISDYRKDGKQKQRTEEDKPMKKGNKPKKEVEKPRKEKANLGECAKCNVKFMNKLTIRGQDVINR